MKLKTEMHVVKLPTAHLLKLKSYCELHHVTLIEHESLSLILRKSASFSLSSLVCIDLKLSKCTQLFNQIDGITKTIRLVILSNQDHQYHQKLLELGCRGVINLDSEPSAIFNAFNAIVNNELWYPRCVLSSAYSALLSKYQRDNKCTLDCEGLTEKESEITTYLIQGYQNKEIASLLHVSVNTVKSHVQHILKKTGLSNRGQLSRSKRR